MDKKCNKYEAYYVFGNDESFIEHLRTCPDCREQHLKMQKLSDLIKGAAPLYLAKEKRKKIKKVLSYVALFFVCFAGVSFFQQNSYNHTEVLSAESSILYQSGCPVDEYGLLKI